MRGLRLSSLSSPSSISLGIPSKNPIPIATPTTTTTTSTFLILRIPLLQLPVSPQYSTHSWCRLFISCLLIFLNNFIFPQHIAFCCIFSFILSICNRLPPFCSYSTPSPHLVPFFFDIYISTRNSWILCKWIHRYLLCISRWHKMGISSIYTSN